MSVVLSEATVESILTRTTGYLRGVTSHSLQPYRGCTYGNALCGVGCYVRHNTWLARGAEWGGFLEARVNAAEVYRRQYARERDWARRSRARFSIFMSSSTDPFVPQERRFRVTGSVLDAMIELPPDELVVQTHSHRVTDYVDLYRTLGERSDLRVHVSIESDRDRLPGLPAPASSVRDRLDAAAALTAAGVRVVVTVSPLFPMLDPRAFFERVASCASAVVIDHFIGGDGSPGGARTLRTALPAAMAAVDPASVTLAYRDRVVAIAEEVMPGRVGVAADGFAGRLVVHDNR